jgi:hypothetical protein
LRHRLAELTVAGKVEADFGLSLDHLCNRCRELLGKRALIGCPPRLDQVVWARQAAGVTGEDMI